MYAHKLNVPLEFLVGFIYSVSDYWLAGARPKRKVKGWRKREDGYDEKAC